MTNVRANAYQRVVETLRNVGSVTLWPAEVACIREAADALLFCRDLDVDAAVREAMTALGAVGDAIVAAGRWTPQRAQRLLDDVWACGPGAALVLPSAA
jgi:hypothetical protein